MGDRAATAGGVEIGSADLFGPTTLAALATFTAIAASTTIVPVGAYLIAGARLDARLRRARDRLIRKNPAVMAVVLVAVGALFITEALGIRLN